MSKVVFNLQKTTEGWTGIGYKAIAKNFASEVTNYPFILNEWMTAEKYGELPRQGRIWQEHRILDYPRGFHIFLKQGEAKLYNPRYTDIYQVLYRNVIGFGKNQVGDFSPTSVADCIIALEMKILEKVGEAQS